MKSNRAAWAAPMAAAVLALAACAPMTASLPGDLHQQRAHRQTMHSTEICHMPAYISERAPEGLCSAADEKSDGAAAVADDKEGLWTSAGTATVDDNLSLADHVPTEPAVEIPPQQVKDW